MQASLTLYRCKIIFYKQRTAYKMLQSLVGSEMCIRDQYVFPFDNVMQCFSHIVRKFRIDQIRKGNGCYRRKAHNMLFLEKVAIEDVRKLYRCRTFEMFQYLAKLVL